jgi:hypothetical protein
MLRYFDAISSAAGVDLAWNMQYLEGSSIRQRREGPDPVRPDQSYRHGVDRWGRLADPVAEFSRGAADGRAIDTLIVTEQHALLNSLAWQDALVSLRDIHARFVEFNPHGRTLFFEPWLSVDDKSAPQRWIEYERAAAPVWRCVVEAVNRSLDREVDPNGIASIPMGLGLAALAERLTGPQSPAFVSARPPADRLALLFDDDVHLSPLGDFYVAYVLFRYLFSELPLPELDLAGIDAGALRELAAIADAFVQQVPLRRGGMSSQDCRNYIAADFVGRSVDYYARSDWSKAANWVRAQYTKWKIGREWTRIFQPDAPENPFLKLDAAASDQKRFGKSGSAE